MRKGERVEINEEVSKQLMDIVKNNYVGADVDKVLVLYLSSYLPIMSDSLASIADSLEILTKDVEEKEEENGDNTKTT